jgi:3-oxoacyl-(acyl-carrier-protein) synthase
MVNLNTIVVNPQFQDEPQKASRPFDTRRCGFLPSHGAAVIILEELHTALNRGAHIYAELLNVRASADGSHLPSPSSNNQKRLIVDLLSSANVPPESIDYVNCHATSTRLGDLEELAAIKMAFGDHAYKLKLNATKSMIGHTCWAAALVETIGAILQMNGGSSSVHKYRQSDPAVDPMYVRTKRGNATSGIAKNSLGFGGLNSAVYLNAMGWLIL